MVVTAYPNTHEKQMDGRIIRALKMYMETGQNGCETGYSSGLSHSSRPPPPGRFYVFNPLCNLSSPNGP